MSKYIEVGKDYNYKIDFIVDGDFVSPDSASVTLTNNAGTVVGSIQDTPVTIPSGATSALFTVPGSANTKTLAYELRYLTVTFIYQGKTYQIRDFYAIRDSLRLPITYDDVRALSGLSNAALPDERIDLLLAYSQVQLELPDLNLDNLLATGSAQIPYLQQAVALKAAINSTGVLELMVFQSEQADNTLYKRFATMDFADIGLRLSNLYRFAIAQLSGETIDSAINGPIFVVVTGDDPVTGA